MEKKVLLSLKAARINSGLATNDILKRMHKTATWLSLVENGQRGIQADVLFKLLDIYGCSRDIIFLPERLSKQKTKLSIRKSLSSAKRKRAK